MKFYPFRDETKWVEKKIYPIFSPNLIKPMILYLEIIYFIDDLMSFTRILKR